jgi:hypothetical protein
VPCATHRVEDVLFGCEAKSGTEANFAKDGVRERVRNCARLPPVVSTSLLVTHRAQVYVLGENVQRILLLNVKLFCS